MPAKSSQINQPGKTVLIGEIAKAGTANHDDMPMGLNTYGDVGYPHSKQGNVSWVDGHAESVRTEALKYKSSDWATANLWSFICYKKTPVD